MANFNYTAGARFTPFTFEEMLKPLAMYTELYNALEEDLSKLEEDALLLEQLAYSNPNSNSYKKYLNYLSRIENSKKEFYNKGLTPSSRRDLLNDRKYYKKEIKPIEEALNTLKLKALELAKLKATDDSIMFDIDFSTIDIDRLVDNPLLLYSVTRGNDLYAKGKEAAKAASLRLIEYSPALGQQYWKIRQGYGAEAANKFLLDLSNIPELKDAVNRILSQSNVSEENKARAIDYTISGIMSGLSYEEKLQENRDFTTALQKEQLDYYKAQREAAEAERNLKLYGTPMADGSTIKMVGSGKAIKISPDKKSYEVINFNNKSDNTSLNKEIKDAAKIRDKTFVVAYTGGKWRAGQEGQDVTDTYFGMTRSNLVTLGSNYTTNTDAEKIIVNNINEIPPKAAERIGTLVRELNLDLEAYNIVKVKAKEGRAAGDYDYILVPKSEETFNNNNVTLNSSYEDLRKSAENVLLN